VAPGVAGDRRVDSFGSALFSRFFNVENLGDKTGSVLALQHIIPPPRTILSPVRLLLSLLKVSFF
jgi:hypothetical protein